MSADIVSQGYVQCPFCNEADFDHAGLRLHLNRDWCPGFSRAASPSCWSEWVAMSDAERAQVAA
ncbi:MAG: hypothetical protein EOO77_19445 [Oxalobacteraceae bacterium]|nr:MAG: hypothetical protein EOO77_19445 [Oxalobacteraceae bacterium]